MRLDDANDPFADEIKDFIDKAYYRMTDEEQERGHQILSKMLP
jgi:hypothetical protein